MAEEKKMGQPIQGQPQQQIKVPMNEIHEAIGDLYLQNWLIGKSTFNMTKEYQKLEAKVEELETKLRDKELDNGQS